MPNPLAARVAIIVVMNFEKTAQEVADLGVASIGLWSWGKASLIPRSLSEKSRWASYLDIAW